MHLILFRRFGEFFSTALCRRILFGAILWASLSDGGRAAPVEFSIPVQKAPESLQQFIKQSGNEVLFPVAELREVTANAVTGAFEAEEALRVLLKHTGFSATTREAGRFVVVRDPLINGTVRGTVVKPELGSSAGIRILVRETGQQTVTDRRGDFVFMNVAAGAYTLVATAEGLQPMHITDVTVRAGRELILSRETMRAAGDVTELEPFIVRGRVDEVTELDKYVVEGQRQKPMVAGNIDLPRSENDALPYQVFTRSDIQRSGLLDLNEFMQRELLETNPTTLNADQQSTSAMGTSAAAASGNLAMRGYSTSQTIVLVNGRRMIGSVIGSTSGPADISAIPLAMIERVEVLPASASAIYGAGAVAGVINIVLRANFQATEITTSYNNAFSFDAPQKAVSLVHGQTLLDGKIDVKLAASFREIRPPLESDLNYIKNALARDRAVTPLLPTADVYAATPHIRSTDGSPLFGLGTPAFTSVAPGADGRGGLAAFVGRQGVRNLDFYAPAAGYGHASGVGTGSLMQNDGNVYGRRSEQVNLSGNLLYRVLPWLEVAVDLAHSRSDYYLGTSILRQSLTVPANSPFNPFGKAVVVTLLDSLSAFGSKHSRAERESNSATLGFLVKMPRNWQLSVDAQAAISESEYTYAGVNSTRLNELVASGAYNPFRDTRAYAIPQAVYDYAAFVSTFDRPYKGTSWQTNARLSNHRLPLPTGEGVLVVGGDFLRTEGNGYAYVSRFADGSRNSGFDAGANAGRQRDDWGIFAELQAPLVPKAWLPRAIERVSGDLAWRYAGSNTFKSSSNPPTLGFKLDLKGGFSLRTTYTTAYVPPTPDMSVPTEEGVPSASNITDPRRNNEIYTAQALSSPNPDLLPEDATTRTYGLIFQRGQRHRIRMSVDYVDTVKVNELTTLSANNLLLLEGDFPERIVRGPLAPGDTASVGRVTFLRTGYINVAGRSSKNWSGDVRYSMTDFFGGALQMSARGAWFQSYKTQTLPTSPVIENIDNPDASFSFLKYRASFNAGWSKPQYGFGLDGRYYHSSMLPISQHLTQGSDRLDRYWEFDAYVNGDLARFMPWKNPRYGVRGQLRVNNVFGAEFPFYNSSAYDVQPYGDWRGRMYSASLTVSF
ncbi:TonB-dependent receptor plug domain-containing protein [Oleiharenicola lentus]|uniref:TonB-dependent receptor plug domain-containing protein n=1 Tax=Oleiharenicola lentus TaxID=2508720 RepID=UPI003F667C52